MKTLLITQRLTEVESYSETRECLDIRWGAFISSLGFIPVSIPILADPAPYFETLAPAGVILSGGNDLYSVSETQLNERRDRFESKVLQLALSFEVPVLGVCRGAQFLAEHFQGSVGKVIGHTGTRHGLRVASNQPPKWAEHLLPSLVELKEVGSFHNWGIKSTGLILTPLSLDEDGHVEAFAHPSKRIAGVMWHPEREEPSENQQTLLRKFFNDR